MDNKEIADLLTRMDKRDSEIDDLLEKVRETWRDFSQDLFTLKREFQQRVCPHPEWKKVASHYAPLLVSTTEKCEVCFLHRTIKYGEGP